MTENNSMWWPTDRPIIGNAMPPRDPEDDEEDEDEEEEDEDRKDQHDEPAVVREPDDDD
jgi:hypothetical protein